MELILKSDNETSIAKIIALAQKLHVSVEQVSAASNELREKEQLKMSILNFKAKGPSSFGDALEWQQKERDDRDLPFFE